MTRSLAVFAAALCLPMTVGAAGWDPQAFSQEETLEFLTVGPEEGEHWSTVWLVVLDNQVYIRLGTRAAGRMEQNTTKPLVKLKIAAQQFDRVKAEPVPDMAPPVATAMGEKYWSDFLVHHFDHPLTMRLAPAE